MSDIVIAAPILRQALPMMAVLSPDGTIVDRGLTLEKLSPGVLGQRVEAVFCIVQPAIPATFAAFLRAGGARLRVQLLNEAGGSDGARPTLLRCASTPLRDGRCLVNLTFGADPTEALRRHRLTAQDFRQTDPMVDFLFLQEAHAIVLSEFQRLSDRLEADRAAAAEEAVTDKLTGLRNRRAMDVLLESLGRRAEGPFALMHLDLDYFKSVNDTLGHAAGDRMLEEVGAILRDVVRRGDMVARMGGDEFMLVLANASDLDRVRGIAERIIEQLERPVEWQGNVIRISGSIGIAMSDAYDPVDPARMIADADDALYACKRAGRARYRIADPGGAVPRAG